jgi:hypothetical protein
VGRWRSDLNSNGQKHGKTLEIKVDRWRFGLSSNGRKDRKPVRKAEKNMAEGMKYGGICGGVEGNIREWVKMFGREAFCFPPIELLTESFREFREKEDVLSLEFREK